MKYGALAEVIGIDGNAGSGDSVEEIEALLNKTWEETGTWAAAVAAGNADEPMRAIATIDAGGAIHWEPA